MATKPRVTFLAQQPVDLLLFRFTSIDLAIPEIQLFKNWPWKSKIKAMAKVKTGGYIWSPMYNRCVYFSFRAIGSFLTKKKEIKYLIWKFKENSRSSSWQSGHFWLRYGKFYTRPWKFKVKVTTKIDQTIIRFGPSILLKMKEIRKVVRKISQKSAAGGGGGTGGGVGTGTKT